MGELKARLQQQHSF